MLTFEQAEQAAEIVDSQVILAVQDLDLDALLDVAQILGLKSDEIDLLNRYVHEMEIDSDS